MQFQKIINSKLDNLDEFISRNKKNYESASPFPFIVIEDFFSVEFLNEILKQFPNLEEKKKTTNYSNKNEVKFANNEYERFPKNIKTLFDFLNSNFFVDFLQGITGITEKLVPDFQLNGGGLHEIKKGGLLKIHSDFNRHPNLDLDRRLNVLIYLNKNWKEEYGGHLEFWDKDMKACRKKILPVFNKMVIFSTTDNSNHGHPDPLSCPDIISRKSIATYYYSKGRPLNEIDKMFSKNTTYFKDRAGQYDETEQVSGKFRRFLRSLNIYQKFKIIEKKLIRTGRSKRKRENQND
ncbi:2OG-Fe(II) oxygenase [Pelagibacterales bacterium SAG-MED39]|nr:2OG-Fe(II) oxygenase [Pelagibacterales bacterium SAG-MED39]